MSPCSSFTENKTFLLLLLRCAVMTSNGVSIDPIPHFRRLSPLNLFPKTFRAQKEREKRKMRLLPFHTLLTTYSPPKPYPTMSRLGCGIDTDRSGSNHSFSAFPFRKKLGYKERERKEEEKGWHQKTLWSQLPQLWNSKWVSVCGCAYWLYGSMYTVRMERKLGGDRKYVCYMYQIDKGRKTISKLSFLIFSPLPFAMLCRNVKSIMACKDRVYLLFVCGLASKAKEEKETSWLWWQ